MRSDGILQSRLGSGAYYTVRPRMDSTLRLPTPTLPLSFTTTAKVFCDSIETAASTAEEVLYFRSRVQVLPGSLNKRRYPAPEFGSPTSSDVGLSEYSTKYLLHAAQMFRGNLTVSYGTGLPMRVDFADGKMQGSYILGPRTNKK